MVSLYIHIPFCRAKCRYCDFNSYAGLEGMYEEYVGALVAEAEGWKGKDLRAETVYFGGGTPTVLAPSQMARIFAACQESFTFTQGAETTLEANPGTAGLEHFVPLRGLGFNRLSLGLQSFDDGMLELLGRIHSAEEGRRAYREAREAGFQNISLDLMYALPGQSLGRWKDTLRQALRLGPEHLSLYPLTLEAGTPLAADVAQGRLPPPDEDLAAEMYELAEDSLGKAGYEHYELSNWARPGFYAQHNLTYWHNHPYLGLGAGAHSYYGGERYHNVLHPVDYIRLVGEGRSPIAEREAIGQELEMAETAILGLRLCQGLEMHDFEARFRRSFWEVYGVQAAELVGLGLLERTGAKLRLTRRGRLLGNEVFARFLPEKA